MSTAPWPAGLTSIEPELPSGLPALDATAGEEIRLSVPALVHFDVARCEGSGTLHVTTRRIVWLSEGRGFAVEFQQLIMHAIARADGTFAHDCIYTHIDGAAAEAVFRARGDGGEEDGEEADDEPGVLEMRLVPTDAGALDNIFKVLCECAALNPDPDQDDDGAGEFFFDEAEVRAGAGGDERGVLLDRLDAMVLEDPSRFEDAGDEEEYDDDDDEEPGHDHDHGDNGATSTGR